MLEQVARFLNSGGLSVFHKEDEMAGGHFDACSDTDCIQRGHMNPDRASERAYREYAVKLVNTFANADLSFCELEDMLVTELAAAYKQGVEDAADLVEAEKIVETDVPRGAGSPVEVRVSTAMKRLATRIRNLPAPE